MACFIIRIIREAERPTWTVISGPQARRSRQAAAAALFGWGAVVMLCEDHLVWPMSNHPKTAPSFARAPFAGFPSRLRRARQRAVVSRERRAMSHLRGNPISRSAFTQWKSSANMEKNPTCPNCGRTMNLIRSSENGNDQHAFKCTACQLVFMTPDHQPVRNQLK
jgi:predicted RNA-binding Zn-ribbon protein involved in translation (DUF1610 family)